MHDLVIRGAKICDGTGATMYPGEVAISDGRITAVSTDEKGLGDASEIVDADGLVLMPGIIDNHTHYDAQITWDAYASPSMSLGVTTLIMGNCGFTIAPCRPSDRDQTLKSLTQVEGMSLDALREGTSRDYETFPEYMNLIEGSGVVPNVAVYCGHSSIRTWVMGDASTERTATDDEIEQMKAVVGECLDHGAIGFATSTYQGHNGWGGVPMPSRFADDRELRALVNVLGEKDRGCFMLTKGNETPVPYLETLAADSGRPVVVAAVLHDKANPENASNDLKAIDDAVKRGRRMVAQVACTPISMDFTLRGAYLFEGCAAWKPAIALYEQDDALAQFYRDAEFRAAMKQELVAPEALNRFTDQWDELEIIQTARPENGHLEGAMVGKLAADAGKDPLDWMLDFGETENFDTLFNAPIVNSDEDQVLPLLKDSNSTIGLADAGAHLFLFCDADFGLHLLGRWTRERQDFSFEEAVRELTSRQAETYGLVDRGRIAPGCHADLLLVDPATVGRGQKRRHEDLPAGASRLVREAATGIHGIWINGTQMADANGVLDNGLRPGHLLREFDS